MRTARFHVPMQVADLDANVRFYTRLLDAEPSVLKPDRAKWMLEATYYASDIGHPAAVCAGSPLRSPASVAETRACGTGGGVAA